MAVVINGYKWTYLWTIVTSCHLHKGHKSCVQLANITHLCYLPENWNSKRLDLFYDWWIMYIHIYIMDTPVIFEYCINKLFRHKKLALSKQSINNIYSLQKGKNTRNINSTVWFTPYCYPYDMFIRK